MNHRITIKLVPRRRAAWTQSRRDSVREMRQTIRAYARGDIEHILLISCDDAVTGVVTYQFDGGNPALLCGMCEIGKQAVLGEGSFQET